MKIIFIITLFLIEIVYPIELNISTQKEFEPFLKKLDKSQHSLKFIIRERKTSLEAFNDLKLGISTVAIVRGDILADNVGAKNYFKNSSFSDFKILSKLKEELSTFLYLIVIKEKAIMDSDNIKFNNAFKLLNPKKGKMKNISVGYINDLANYYLSDIADSANSNYRFRYKFFSPKLSLAKLKEGSLDSAYMFVSKKFALKARKNGFVLTNILKPLNVKSEKFSKKISEQKEFNRIGADIRVDNYLIVSSSISDNQLTALVSSLKGTNSLVTNIKPELGAVDTRVAAISTKIDIKKGQAIAEADQKAKECKETSEKSKEISDKQASFKTYEKSVLKRIKKILLTIDNSPELSSFRPRIEDDLLLSVKDSSREAKRLLANVRDNIKECDTAKITSSLVELSSKIDDIKGVRKELAILQGEIIKKRQVDDELTVKEEEAQAEEFAREDRMLQAQLEQESRAIEAELEKEARAKTAELEKLKEEAKKGVFTKIKEAIIGK